MASSPKMSCDPNAVLAAVRVATGLMALAVAKAHPVHVPTVRVLAVLGRVVVDKATGLMALAFGREQALPVQEVPVAAARRLCCLPLHATNCV
jgi:hypothetical protein